MQLLIIKRRGAGSQFLLSNYPATAHMPGMGAKAGAPHAPIPNGGDVRMPKADESCDALVASGGYGINFTRALVQLDYT